MGKTKQKMKRCEYCAKEFARERQIEYLRGKVPQVAPLLELCPACRRARTARLLVEGHRAAARTKM